MLYSTSSGEEWGKDMSVMEGPIVPYDRTPYALAERAHLGRRNGGWDMSPCVLCTQTQGVTGRAITTNLRLYRLYARAQSEREAAEVSSNTTVRLLFYVLY